MKKKQNKKNPARPLGFIKPIIFGFAIVVLLSFVISLYFGQEEKFQKQNARQEELQSKKQKDLAIKEELEDRVINYDLPENLERIARDVYGLVKPDDLLISD